MIKEDSILDSVAPISCPRYFSDRKRKGFSLGHLFLLFLFSQRFNLFCWLWEVGMSRPCSMCLSIYFRFYQFHATGIKNKYIYPKCILLLQKTSPLWILYCTRMECSHISLPLRSGQGPKRTRRKGLILVIRSSFGEKAKIGERWGLESASSVIYCMCFFVQHLPLKGKRVEYSLFTFERFCHRWLFRVVCSCLSITSVFL